MHFTPPRPTSCCAMVARATGWHAASGLFVPLCVIRAKVSDDLSGWDAVSGDLDEGVLGVGRWSAPTVLTVTWSMSYERASTTPMMVLNAASRRFGRFRVDRR